jgi:hypothetical protein
MSDTIILALIGAVVTLGGHFLDNYLRNRHPQQPSFQPSSYPPQIQPGATYSPPQIQPPVALGAVIRDAGLIILLTAISGFIIGLMSAETDLESLLPLLACFNLLILVVGFTVSASVADHGRWQHIGAVGVIVWLFGIINIPLGLANIATWLLSALFIAVCLVVGGSLSYVFKRRR